MENLECKHCGRHLGTVKMLIGEIRCPNSSCKAGNQFKIISSDIGLMSFKFATPPTPPKSQRKESDHA